MKRKNIQTRRKNKRRGGMLKAVRSVLNACVGRTCRARVAGKTNKEKEENAANLAEKAKIRERQDAAVAAAAPLRKRTERANYSIWAITGNYNRQVQRLVNMTQWDFYDMNPEVLAWLNKVAEEAEAVLEVVKVFYTDRRTWGYGNRERGEWSIELVRVLGVMARATEATATANTPDVAEMALRGAGSVERIAYEASRDAAWAVEGARRINANSANTLEVTRAADDAIGQATEASRQEGLMRAAYAYGEQEVHKTAAAAATRRAILACARAMAALARVEQEAEQVTATYWERKFAERAGT